MEDGGVEALSDEEDGDKEVFSDQEHDIKKLVEAILSYIDITMLVRELRRG